MRGDLTGWRDRIHWSGPTGSHYVLDEFVRTDPRSLDVPEPRHVNVTGGTLPAAGPLAGQVTVGGRYLARLSIGERSPDSVIVNAPAFPVENLPTSRRGWWLTLLATGDGLASGKQLSQPLFLPRHGPAYSCECPPGRLLHRCAPEDRRPFADVPARPGTLRLALYLFRGVLVQALKIALAPGSAPRGEVVWSLDVGVSDFDRHARRSASVSEQTDDGRHRLVDAHGVDSSRAHAG
jgi:hypothetical protein